MTTSTPVNDTTPTPPPDPVGETPPTPDEDEHLSDFEKQVVAEFQAREGEQGDKGGDKGGSEDGGGGEAQGAAAGTEAGDQPEGSASQTPPQPSDPSQAPDPSPPAPEGTEGQQEAPPPPTDPETFMGRPATEIKDAVEVYDWAKSLPPEALQGINAYVSGQAVLVPADHPLIAQLQGGGEAASSTSPPPPDPDDPDNYVDPAVARKLAAMEQELANLRETTRSQVAQQQETYMQRVQAAIEVGQTEFAQAHELTEEETQAVVQKATELGTIQTGLAVHKADLNKAVVHALDLAYLSDPSFQQREIDRRVQAQLADQQALAARKARASAVTSASGSATKPTPTPPERMTTAQREAAIAEEIAAAMK